MVTKERLVSGTGNVSRVFAEALGLCGPNEYLSNEEWRREAVVAALFVETLVCLHDTEPFEVAVGPLTFFGEPFADEHGEQLYRAGVRGFGGAVVLFDTAPDIR